MQLIILGFTFKLKSSITQILTWESDKCFLNLKFVKSNIHQKREFWQLKIYILNGKNS